MRVKALKLLHCLGSTNSVRRRGGPSLTMHMWWSRWLQIWRCQHTEEGQVEGPTGGVTKGVVADTANFICNGRVREGMEGDRGVHMQFTCTVPSASNTSKPTATPGPHSTTLHPTRHSHVISGAWNALHPHLPITSVPSGTKVGAGCASGMRDQAASSAEATRGICTSMAQNWL